MIQSTRNRGLLELYVNDNGRYVNPRHVQRLRLILGALDRSTTPQDMNVSGLRLHQLSGPLAGHYSVRVSRNWRVTFRFEDGDVYDVDYQDYH